MSTIHFLNVLEGDCNIIQHDNERVTVIDVSNAYNQTDTEKEKEVKESEERKKMRLRTNVPDDKINFQQKLEPDNPIDYLKKFNINTIFRFIITHPDMDHLDGIRDLYSEFNIINTWDTENNKEIAPNSSFAGYNSEDWDFYTQLKKNKNTSTKRVVYYAEDPALKYWDEDYIKILSPTREIVKNSNDSKNYNNLSYVLLYTPPKADGTHWKIIFAGDSEDIAWDYIIENYSEDVKNIDVLFAPHHGRDSGRNYDFLKTLTPTLTLFGNASSKHLAYNSYPKIRITNNQAGYVILDIKEDGISIYSKNKEFVDHFRKKHKMSGTKYSQDLDAYFLGYIKA